MDYVNLAITGIVKLTKMIATWRAASAEEQAKIYERTERLVNGLGAEFKSADERDAENLRKAEEALGVVGAGSGSRPGAGFNPTILVNPDKLP